MPLYCATSTTSVPADGAAVADDLVVTTVVVVKLFVVVVTDDELLDEELRDDELCDEVDEELERVWLDMRLLPVIDAALIVVGVPVTVRKPDRPLLALMGTATT